MSRAMTATSSRKRKDEQVPESYSEDVAARLREAPPRQKGERTRRRLECAALKVLQNVGYSGMRVTDVAQEADVSLGTFYVYYPDKRDIAAKVLLEFGEALYSKASESAKGATAFEAILRTNRFFLQAYDKNRGLIRCLVQLDDTDREFQEKWRKIRYDWIERIARSIAKRYHPHTLPLGVRFQIANALEGMIFHFLYDMFVREEPQLGHYARDHEEVAVLLSLLWYRAVFGANPPGVDNDIVRQMPVTGGNPPD